MISMPEIQSIRQLRRNGDSIASIARKVGVSEPTVRKYLKMEDLSPRPPVRRKRTSVIDEWVPLIEQWLAEDRESWRRQRHTATRIWERLRDEHGAEVSLSTVTRTVARLRGESASERGRGSWTSCGIRARRRPILARSTCNGEGLWRACTTSCWISHIRTSRPRG